MTTIDRVTPRTSPLFGAATPPPLTLGYAADELLGAQRALECRGGPSRDLLAALGEAHALSTPTTSSGGHGTASAAVAHGPAERHDGDAHDLEHHAHSLKEGIHALEHAGSKTGPLLEVADDLVRGAISGDVAHDLATHHHGHHDGIGSRVVGGLGVAGGVVQVGVGVHELQQGDMVHGTKNVTAGSAYAGAGALELAGTASSVAGGLAGGGALVDGAVNLWDGYQSVDLGKTISGGSMAVGGGVLLGVAAGAVTAPAAAVIGGTLIGGSVVYNAYRHFTDHE